MLFRRPPLLLGLLLLSAPLAQAQQDRFDVGQRLRALERDLNKNTDAKARRRALPSLEKATLTFLSGQLGKTGEVLDLARLALASEKEPAPAVRFARSLAVRPGTRLLDAAT